MNRIDLYLEKLISEQEMFLNYLKAKFPMFHNSNFFFRDLHYGIKSYFDKKGNELSYTESEELAKKYADHLEKKNIFVKVIDNTWRLNFPEFVTTVPGDPL